MRSNIPRRGDNILQKIVDISEECSNTNYEENENKSFENKDEFEILESDESEKQRNDRIAKRKISGIFVIAGKGCISHASLSPRMTQTFPNYPKI